MYNFHCHTPYCGHALNTPMEIVEEAIKKGFTAIGISDHYGKDSQGNWIPHSLKDPVNYFKDCHEAKEAFKDKINVLIGVEMDFYPENHKEIYKEILSYKPDYILGSIHIYKGFYYSGGPTPYADKTNEDMDKIIRTYLECAKKMVMSDCVNCWNHFDLYKKHYKVPDETIYYPYYEDIAKEMKKHNVALEINTHYFPGEFLYELDKNLFMLNLARDLDIPVIISSDAHKKEDLDNKFPEAFALLKSAGIKTTCKFNNLKTIKIPFIN